MRLALLGSFSPRAFPLPNRSVPAPCSPQLLTHPAPPIPAVQQPSARSPMPARSFVNAPRSLAVPRRTARIPWRWSWSRPFLRPPSTRAHYARARPAARPGVAPPRAARTARRVRAGKPPARAGGRGGGGGGSGPDLCAPPSFRSPSDGRAACAWAGWRGNGADERSPAPAPPTTTPPTTTPPPPPHHHTHTLPACRMKARRGCLRESSRRRL